MAISSPPASHCLVIGDVRNDVEIRACCRISWSPSAFATRVPPPSRPWPTAFQPPSTRRTPRAAREPLARERALFDSRRRTLNEQVTSAERAGSRRAGARPPPWSRQIESTETSAKLASEELALNEKLGRQGSSNAPACCNSTEMPPIIGAECPKRKSELSSRVSARAKCKRASRRHAISTSNWRPTKRRSPPRESASWRERLRPSRDQAERAIRPRARRRQDDGPPRRRHRRRGRAS